MALTSATGMGKKVGKMTDMVSSNPRWNLESHFLL
jgi:hypothetical protein